jgi:spore germination protein KB
VEKIIREGQFGFWEALSLATIIIVTKIFYTSPMTIINEFGTAAWYGTLGSCLTAIIFFGLLYLLMKRFPGQDLFQVLETVYGKIVGKILVLILASYFLYYVAMNIREFSAILKAYNLPFTPLSMTIFPFLLVVWVLAYVGLEGIARTTYIFSFLVFGGLALMLLLAIPAYSWDFLQPILGYGLRNTIITGFMRSSAYSEIVILATIIGSLQGLKNFKRVGFSALIISGLTISLCTACLLAAFQFTSGGEHLSGLFQLSRTIYYSRFIQRLEAVFLFTWVFAAVLTVAVVFYISLKAYCRAFQIFDHRPLIFPYIFVTGALISLPKNLPEVLQVHVQFTREFSFLLLFTIPVITLVFAVILKKGQKGEGSNENKEQN